MTLIPFVNLYPSYFKLHVCWLPSFTPAPYLCKLLEVYSVVAFLQLELFRVFVDSPFVNNN
ncbi:hypothetical protein DVP47_06760 [Yersinia enterocolitica]|nr:hypothetical protein [Yersinia enterocolitica]EKN6286821.1 hypothetical protein [Yersinia enterocolitica]EKN6290555.1 hypothetical protein [Yersinia enterocolitica]EKN6300440.1 hypothetical protein [Yersinia enterocolitica]EKN6303642.1 hypothetical protein [Yersinia enterocolitica]